MQDVESSHRTEMRARRRAGGFTLLVLSPVWLILLAGWGLQVWTRDAPPPWKPPGASEIINGYGTFATETDSPIAGGYVFVTLGGHNLVLRCTPRWLQPAGGHWNDNQNCLAGRGQPSYRGHMAQVRYFVLHPEEKPAQQILLDARSEGRWIVRPEAQLAAMARGHDAAVDRHTRFQIFWIGLNLAVIAVLAWPWFAPIDKLMARRPSSTVQRGPR